MQKDESQQKLQPEELLNLLEQLNNDTFIGKHEKGPKISDLINQ